ncbi:hypothetical protein P43SY_008985 [Pythium insidiosum]|uniref:Seipin n=1 Tax=Pythium insidiosum TaxID=114742 RepID=A0AAD5Q4R2_PYTIN|nr:hypothetical protein P43SY_008985 [Pythium insidiosum]
MLPQWTTLWNMAMALLPLPAQLTAGRSREEEAARLRQREELLATLNDLLRLALQWSLRATQLGVGLSVLFATATVLYSALYYLIIPSRLHEQQIFFDYGTHASLSLRDSRSFALTLPTARLDLLNAEQQWTASSLVYPSRTKASTVLVPGVTYDVIVELTVPESATNREIGMFMIDTTLSTREERVLASSARPVIVKDSHLAVQWARALAWLVPYALRLTEPSQTLSVLVVNGYTESNDHPLTGVTITLNHPAVQIYDAKLTIIAQLSGVRYLMYHWSVPTALLVILNIVFVEALALLVVYAYYQLPPPSDGTDDELEARAIKKEEELAGAAVVDQGELFERHRSGGIPPVHVERSPIIKTEPIDTSELLEQAARGAFLDEKQVEEMKLRYRGGADEDDDGANTTSL